jgi:hypothetical protein
VSKQRQDQILGCLLFTPGSWALKARDEWIGWSSRDRVKQLNLIINNSRFLILPWIEVKDLASHALSLATNRLAADWKQLYGYKPVLLETFVDPMHFDGASYKAANWECVGITAGIGGRKSTPYKIEKNRKSVFVFPLVNSFREVLRGKNSCNIIKIKTAKDQEFEETWKDLIEIIETIAKKYDAMWQKRRRSLDSLLLVLIIIRLTLSKNHQGYDSTITAFWHICMKSKISLPNPKTLSGAALCKARKKLDEQIFKDMNSGVIEKYETIDRDDDWFGHRIFAVDGTKLNLPRDLKDEGFVVPANCHYPIGLCSAIYRLKSKIPIDFELAAHNDERKCAETHLKHLNPNDVVVYDRGYLSYRMLNEHTRCGIHGVFRLCSQTFPVIQDFMASSDLDRIVTIMPAYDSRSPLRAKYPGMEISPIQFRVVRYKYDSTTYFVGTTLLAPEYTVNDLSDLYHARWSIEELYKISKSLIGVEEFHSKSAQGVRQEIFAHFFAITLSRLIANHTEDSLNSNPKKFRKLRRDAKRSSEQLKTERTRVNFKNCLLSFDRHLLQLILSDQELRSTVLTEAMSEVSNVSSRTRTGRSFERRSHRVDPRWRPDNKKAKAKAVSVPTLTIQPCAIAAAG